MSSYTWEGGNAGHVPVPTFFDLPTHGQTGSIFPPTGERKDDTRLILWGEFLFLSSMLWCGFHSLWLPISSVSSFRGGAFTRCGRVSTSLSRAALSRRCHKRYHRRRGRCRRARSGPRGHHGLFCGLDRHSLGSLIVISIVLLFVIRIVLLFRTRLFPLTVLYFWSWWW